MVTSPTPASSAAARDERVGHRPEQLGATTPTLAAGCRAASVVLTKAHNPRHTCNSRRGRGTLEHGVHRKRERVDVGRVEVAVDVHRDLDAGVAQLGLDNLRVMTLGDHQRGAGVAEDMKAEPLFEPGRVESQGGRHQRVLSGSAAHVEEPSDEPTALCQVEERGLRATDIPGWGPRRIEGVEVLGPPSGTRSGQSVPDARSRSWQFLLSADRTRIPHVAPGLLDGHNRVTRTGPRREARTGTGPGRADRPGQEAGALLDSTPGAAAHLSPRPTAPNHPKGRGPGTTQIGGTERHLGTHVLRMWGHDQTQGRRSWVLGLLERAGDRGLSLPLAAHAVPGVGWPSLTRADGR